MRNKQEKKAAAWKVFVVTSIGNSSHEFDPRRNDTEWMFRFVTEHNGKTEPYMLEYFSSDFSEYMGKAIERYLRTHGKPAWMSQEVGTR